MSELAFSTSFVDVYHAGSDANLPSSGGIHRLRLSIETCRIGLFDH